MNLRDLSQHLGLSMTTVSRALNGYSDVNENTRARVREAAQAVGYSANPVARRLALGRAEAIGVVLPAPVGHFGDPFFAELLAGMGGFLHDSGVDLIVTAAPAGPDELHAYRRLVEGRRVDALVVGRTRRRDERIQYLLDQNFPFIAYGRSRSDRPYAYLDMDSEQGFAEATARLVDLGHRRIALINAPAEYMFASHRRAGYARALGAAGIVEDAELVTEGDMTEAGGNRCTRGLLDRRDAPTAILCANDRTAIGAMHAVKARRLAVGRNVSIIGYDDLPVASYTEPPLTTLEQPIRAAGVRIAEMLLSRLAGTALEELQEIWPPRLIVRQSDGPAPEMAAATRERVKET